MNKKRFFEKFTESEADSGSQNKPGNYISTLFPIHARTMVVIRNCQTVFCVCF